MNDVVDDDVSIRQALKNRGKEGIRNLKRQAVEKMSGDGLRAKKSKIHSSAVARSSKSNPKAGKPNKKKSKSNKKNPKPTKKSKAVQKSKVQKKSSIDKSTNSFKYF